MEKGKTPFEVRTVDGAYVDTFLTLDVAQGAAETKNKQAEELGIKARYVAVTAD